MENIDADRKVFKMKTNVSVEKKEFKKAPIIDLQVQGQRFPLQRYKLKERCFAKSTKSIKIKQKTNVFDKTSLIRLESFNKLKLEYL